MSISQRERRVFTPQEYLTLERSTASKSEWLDGEIFAMGGGSPEHNTIQGNLYGELYRQLKGRNCQYFGSDQKVRSPLAGMLGLFTYPDATVVCGQPLYHDAEVDVLVNPTVIFEVLSPSTEAYDRGEKRLRYQAMPSLVEYVLVAQQVPLIERWVRAPDGAWVVSRLEGLGATLVLDAIGCTITLADIYDRIKF